MADDPQNRMWRSASFGEVRDGHGFRVSVSTRYAALSETQEDLLERGRPRRERDEVRAGFDERARHLCRREVAELDVETAGRGLDDLDSQPREHGAGGR